MVDIYSEKEKKGKEKKDFAQVSAENFLFRDI